MKRSRPCSKRPPVERLELRRLLTVQLTDGALSLIGGGGNDAFVVTRSGNDIAVTENGGAARHFAYTSVNHLFASLGNGNDTINISTNITLSAKVEGGDGADGIITGGGDDVLIGGAGDDYLDGRGGSDSVDYGTRTAPVTAKLSMAFDYFRPTYYFVTGEGGEAGEHDTYANVETINGGQGNDTLGTGVSGYRPDNDNEPLPAFPPLRINGSGGDDELAPRGASGGVGESLGYPFVTADGGDGDDYFILAGTGRTNTTMIGGAGNDFFDQWETDASATIVPGADYDRFRYDGIAQGDYTMPDGLEELNSQNGNFAITGNDQDNVITGYFEYVDARGGNDLVSGRNYGAYTINGGTGNDTLIGQSGGGTIDGGIGDDRIGGAYGNTVTGGEGNDTLIQDARDYGSGITTFDGGPGTNRVEIDDTAFGYNEESNKLTYTLTANSIKATFAEGDPAGVIFSNVTSLRVDSGIGNDTFDIVSTAPGLKTTFNGGDGDDEFVINDGTWRDDVTLLGGAGDDFFLGFTTTPLKELPLVQGGADNDYFQINGTLASAYTIPDDLERFGVYKAAANITGNALANDISVATVEGNPTIDARGGNDTIAVGVGGGHGYGTVLGGEGNDSIRGSADNLYIDAGGGDDRIEVNSADENDPADQTVISGSGHDRLLLLPSDIGYGRAAIAHLVRAESFDYVAVGGGARLIVEQGATPEANPLYVKELYFDYSSSEYDPPGSIDLGDNSMIVSEMPTADGWVLEDMTTYIQRGKFGGPFGKRGVYSSLADSTPGMTLGVARANEIYSTFPTPFAGHSVSPTDIIVRYTRAGDANLDRKVDFNDLVILAQNYNKTGRSYAQGNLDLSRDGTADFNDLVVLAQNYGSSAAALSAMIAPPAAPPAPAPPKVAAKKR